MRETGSNTVLIALAIIFVLSILTMVVLQAPATSTLLAQRGLIPTDEITPQAGPTPSPVVRPLIDTDLSSKITLRNPALGFTLEYPAGWHKRETTLTVMISPSIESFEPDQPLDSLFWVGIPADDQTTPDIVLQDLMAKFDAAATNQATLTLGGERWDSRQISFTASDLGGTGQAILAATSKNQVSYFLVALAPADQWEAVQPTFQQMFDSFQFSQQAVLRPTDATPPPTPTPTPTPVIYVIQSGDTLMGIALRYGVDMDALANRNGISDPSRLRTGQELIIPIRR